MRTRNLILLSASTCLASCAMAHDHNDVMVFGTTTTIAIDVSAPVQNAGIPAFTVGYKRHEAVWMPLREAEAGATDAAGQAAVVRSLNTCMSTLSGTVSDDNVRASLCFSTVMQGSKYVGVASGVDDSTGGENIEIDTYSVFASFGGRGSLGFNDASGQLAQFFATGIAAQRLGANQAVGLALNADAPAAVQAQAQAQEAQAASVARVAALTGRADALQTCLADDTKRNAIRDNDLFNGREALFDRETPAQLAVRLRDWGDPRLSIAEGICNN